MRRRVRVIMMRVDTHVVAYVAGVRRRGLFRMVGQVEVVNSSYGYYYLRRLHVYPGWRERGVATRLMRRALRDAGPYRVELLCNPAYGSGLDEDELGWFYRGFGFEYAKSAHAARDPRDSDAQRMARPGKKIKPGK